MMALLKSGVLWGSTGVSAAPSNWPTVMTSRRPPSPSGGTACTLLQAPPPALPPIPSHTMLGGLRKMRELQFEDVLQFLPESSLSHISKSTDQNFTNFWSVLSSSSGYHANTPLLWTDAFQTKQCTRVQSNLEVHLWTDTPTHFSLLAALIW